MPKKLGIEQVKKLFKEDGYILLTQDYQNAFQKLTVKCKSGHIKQMTLSQLYKHQKCNKCVSHNKLSIKNVKECFKKAGYLLQSDFYVGARDKLQVLCPRTHEWYVSINKFKAGQRCPKCSFLGGNSKMEQELCEAIKLYYPTVKKAKMRNIHIKAKPHIKGFDIDIYLQDRKLGIEFDGTYFHSFEGLKRGYKKWPLTDLKNYHKIKDEYFKSIGISILHISESEWIKDRIACIDKCLLFLKEKR